MFCRAVAASIVTRAGLTFALDIAGGRAVIPLATPIRTWLLAVQMSTGGVAATVAPSFLSGTYPAMLALVQALNEAGLGAAWRSEGVRTLRLGQAAHVFVSADRSVAEHTPAPGSLLEVIESHTVGTDWYAARVAPRATGPGLTRVFYGLPGARGSVYDFVRRQVVAMQARDSVKRLFSMLEIPFTGRSRDRTDRGGSAAVPAA